MQKQTTTVKMPGKGVSDPKATAKKVTTKGLKKISSVHKMSVGGKVNTY